MLTNKKFKARRDLAQWLLRYRVWIAALFSVAVLLLSEILHWIFTPNDAGIAFFPAHLLTAVIAGTLFERVLYATLQQYASALENMRTISIMNHHIRNALEAIALLTYFMQNKSLVPTIMCSVERIDQALRLAEKGIRPMVVNDQLEAIEANSESMAAKAGDPSAMQAATLQSVPK